MIGNPLKILLVSHNWSTVNYSDSHHFSNITGYGRLAHYLALNNDVTVLTLGKTNDSVIVNDSYKLITVRGSKLQSMFFNRVKLSWFAKQLSRNFDIVHSLYSDTSLLLLDLPNLVITYHVLPRVAKYRTLKPNLFLYMKYYLLQYFPLLKCDNNIAIASNIPLKYPRHKFNIIHHGVDTKFWSRGNVNKSDMEIKLNSNYKNIILCVGYHALKKIALIEAIDGLKDALFIVVGKGVNIQRKNLLHFQNISDEELRFLYYSSDIFFRPIEFATANNSILEAMCMELPIVTSRTPGILDYIDDRMAYLSDNNNSYVKLLKFALSNPGISRSKAMKAQKTVLENFSWDVINNITEKYYLDITNR